MLGTSRCQGAEQARQEMAELTPKTHIRSNCPACGAKFKLRIFAAGRRARCKSCGVVFTVPGNKVPLEDSVISWLGPKKRDEADEDHDRDEAVDAAVEATVESKASPEPVTPAATVATTPKAKSVTPVTPKPVQPSAASEPAPVVQPDLAVQPVAAEVAEPEATEEPPAVAKKLNGIKSPVRAMPARPAQKVGTKRPKPPAPKTPAKPPTQRLIPLRRNK